jgi:hypothetical protein
MTQHTPMPPKINLHNGLAEPCDMAIGPCRCGAWHSITDWVNRWIESEDAAERAEIDWLLVILKERTT